MLNNKCDKASLHCAIEFCHELQDAEHYHARIIFEATLSTWEGIDRFIIQHEVACAPIYLENSTVAMNMGENSFKVN